MKEEDVKNLVEKLKNAIKRLIKRKKYDSALDVISTCGHILYNTNLYYKDEYLEDALKEISKALEIYKFNKSDYVNSNTILFWDGFGYNDRGLARIYIEALCKIGKVVYVTYKDRRDEIPDIKSILCEYESDAIYINRKHRTKTSLIEEINGHIERIKPGHIFLYSVPDEVVMTTIMYAYEGVIDRYQINLTDHAFWIGTGCIDHCIEFRDYGARISNEYRGIPKERIRIIPFYPIIKHDRVFGGYPFERKAGQKVIFSGGALYKTFGENNRYYKMVDHILDNHENVIFWYAGSGDDTEIKKLSDKYQGRIVFTAERNDLYQVLENVDVYLSTYPICGGLMYQYAAMAGKVPVTLRYDEDNEGFLINQMDIGIEFDEEEGLYDEIDKLLTDEMYAEKRGDLMKKSVISKETFETEVKRALDNEVPLFKSDYEPIDTREFRSIFIERLSKEEFDHIAVRKESIKIAVRYYPLRFVSKVFSKCSIVKV